MPNILTFNASGQCTGWRKSIGQLPDPRFPRKLSYESFHAVVECMEKPDKVGDIIQDGEGGWRYMTEEELAARAEAEVEAQAQATRMECEEMLNEHPHLAPTLIRVMELKAEAEALGATFEEDIPSYESIAAELVELFSAHGLEALALHSEFTSLWGSVAAIAGPDPRGQELMPYFLAILQSQ